MQPPRRLSLLGALRVAVLASLWAMPVAAADRSLTLSRLPCYEGCPSYRVTLHESGKIEIQGRQNVPWVGTHAEKGSASAVVPVFARADAAGFSGFRAAYGIGCQTMGAAGLATLSLTTGGATKKVSFQTGCSGADGSLTALEGLAAEVDRAALTPQRLQAMGAPAETTAPSPVLADSAAEPVVPEPAVEEPAEEEPAVEEPIAVEPQEPEAAPAEDLAAPEEPEEPASTAALEPTPVEPESGPQEAPVAETDTEDAEQPTDIAAESPTEAGEAWEEEAPEATPEPPSTVEETELAVAEGGPLEEQEMEEPRQPEPPSDPGSDRATETSDEDPEEPARELLGRFEQAYNACDIESMREVVELDAATESFLSLQCSRCGGFDVDVELIDWVEAPNRVDLYFEQRVRCRRSRTLSIFDLVAEVPRSPSPWRIDRIGRAP